MEQAIKLAKLRGFTGNAYLEGCPGWVDDIDGHHGHSHNDRRGGPDRQKGASKGPTRRVVLAKSKGTAVGKPPARLTPRHKRQGSTSNVSDQRDPSDLWAGTAKDTASTVGGARSATGRGAARHGPKMIWSSEVGEPPSPFVRFGLWVARHMRTFFRETDGRLLLSYLFLSLLFVIDVGVLSALLVAIVLGVCLVAEKTSHSFWQALQTYLEAMIVIDYLLEIFTSLYCKDFGPYSVLSVNVLYAGLHEHAASAIPLFLAYLSLIAYTAALRTRRAFSRAAERAAMQGAPGRPLLSPGGGGAGAGGQGGQLPQEGFDTDAARRSSSDGAGGDGGARRMEALKMVGTAKGAVLTSQYEVQAQADKRVKEARELRRMGQAAETGSLRRQMGGKGLRGPRGAEGRGQQTHAERAQSLWRSVLFWARLALTRALVFARGTATSTERQPYFARVVVALNTREPVLPTGVVAPGAGAAAAVPPQSSEAHARMQEFLQAVLDTVRIAQVRHVERKWLNTARHDLDAAPEVWERRGAARASEKESAAGPGARESGNEGARGAGVEEEHASRQSDAGLSGESQLGSPRQEVGSNGGDLASPGDPEGVRMGLPEARWGEGQVNLAAVGPMDLRLYRLEQIVDPAEAMQLPVTERLGRSIRGWTILALTVELFPRTGFGPAHRKGRGLVPRSVTPSRDFVRALVLAGRHTRHIDQMWAGQRPQWMRDMLPMLEGLALSTKIKGRDAAGVTWREYRCLLPSAALGSMLTCDEGVAEVADLDRLQRRRSLGIDTGVDLAALDPTLVTDMQGDVAPAALHAPSPIRLKVAEGLVPGRDAMPGDSDDEIMEEEKAQGWQGTQGPDSGRVTPSPHRPQLRSDASGRRHPDRSVANSLSGIRRDTVVHHTESSGPLDLASRSMAASRSEVDLTRAVRHLPMARAAHAPLQAVPWGRSPTQSHDFELRAAQSGGWGAQGRMAGVGDEGTLRGGVGADGLPALARRPGIGIESVYRSSSDMANRASFDAPGVGVGALGSHQHQRSPFSATTGTPLHPRTPPPSLPPPSASSAGAGVSITLEPTPEQEMRSDVVTPTNVGAGAGAGVTAEAAAGAAVGASPGEVSGPRRPAPPPAASSVVTISGVAHQEGGSGRALRVAGAAGDGERPSTAGPVMQGNGAGEGHEGGVRLHPNPVYDPALPDCGYGGSQILHIEGHSRERQDFYPVTIGLDFLAFLYAAIFFRATFPTVADFANTGTSIVPLSFLGLLIGMFLLMVLDRLAYTMGSHFLKAIVHYFQVSILVGGVTSAYWYSSLKSPAGVHLRIFLLLKGSALVFGALQLRSGYPEASSYRNGIGRYSQLFLQFPNAIGWYIYTITTGIPFVFELRHLLDWACTLTTLRFSDWLLIEDIHAALFLATFDRNIRHFRYLGRKEPSWRKVLQGVLLFCALCALVWMPLMLFAAYNPAFQVPTVHVDTVQVSIGATLPTSTSVDGAPIGAKFTVPVYTGGYRWSTQDWTGANARPPELSNYAPSALQLLCIDPRSSTRWQVTPPLRARLAAVLADPLASVTVDFQWSFSRNDKAAGECQAQVSTELSPTSVSAVLAVLNGTATRATLDAAAGSEAGLYTLFWRVGGSTCSVNTGYQGIDLLYSRREKYAVLREAAAGEGSSASSTGLWTSDQKVFCDLQLDTDAAGDAWWAVYCGYASNRAAAFSGASTNDSHATCYGNGNYNGPQVVTLLDKVSTGGVGSQLSSLSISGLYLGVVWAVGKFVRVSVTNMKLKIPYEQTPDPKRMRALIDDIYIARAEGDLEMEEELFWTLVTIYRVPSVLFELTRKKLK